MHLFESVPQDLVSILGIYLDKNYLNILIKLFNLKFEYEVILSARYPVFFNVIYFLKIKYVKYHDYSYARAYELVNDTEKIIDFKVKYGTVKKDIGNWSSSNRNYKPMVKISYVNYYNFIEMIGVVLPNTEIDKIIKDFIRIRSNNRYSMILNALEIFPYDEHTFKIEAALQDFIQENLDLSQILKFNPADMAIYLSFYVIENKEFVAARIHLIEDYAKDKFIPDYKSLILFESIIEYLKH
jgi:hypothetical protein